MRRFFEGGDARPMQRMRQAGLVDDVDSVLRRMRAQGTGGDAVDVHGSDSRGIGAQPGGEFGFRQVAGGQGEHGLVGIFWVAVSGRPLRRRNIPAPEKAGTFVAVDERMIVGEPKA